MYLLRELLGVARTFLRRFSQRTHFVGHDRESASVIARACCLDRGIKREEIGLVGNVADRFRNIADHRGLLAQLFDDGYRPRLPFSAVFDVRGPGSDLGRAFRDQALQHFCSPLRLLGAVAGLDQR